MECPLPVKRQRHSSRDGFWNENSGIDVFVNWYPAHLQNTLECCKGTRQTCLFCGTCRTKYGTSMTHVYNESWQGKYGVRCPLIRYKQAKKKWSENMVKFFYNDGDITSEEFVFVNTLHMEDCSSFMKGLAVPLNEASAVELSLKEIEKEPETKQFWGNVLKYADDMKITIPRSGSEIGIDSVKYRILTKKEKEKYTKRERSIIDKFITALNEDFTNGDAKRWVDHFIQKILMALPDDDLELSRTEVCDSMASRYQDCETEEHFSSPYLTERIPVLPGRSADAGVSAFQPIQCTWGTLFSPSRTRISPAQTHPSAVSSQFSPASTTDKEGHPEVPDVQVTCLGYQPSIPMVIELKGSLDDEKQAYKQNIRQMLTKFFHQDIICGIIISPIGFVIQALVKSKKTDLAGCDKRKINLHRSQMFSFFPNEDRILDINNLKLLFNFIYSFCDWSIQSQCILHS